MIIRNRTTKALKGLQTTGRGATPAIAECKASPERATDYSATPSGLNIFIAYSRGCTPACSLISPSGFGGTIADNHLFFYGYEFLLLPLAAWAAPCVGQVFKLGSGRYSLLGVTFLWVVSVLTGAFHLCHSQKVF